MYVFWLFYKIVVKPLKKHVKDVENKQFVCGLCDQIVQYKITLLDVCVFFNVFLEFTIVYKF